METLANVPAIIRNGAAWYRKFGTPKSPGTKVYTILGNVNVTGVIEVPMGITLREVISIYAKGMKNGATFKVAQTGGSSGSIIPASLQDTPMDFESFGKAGVSLGSGALLICDENTCVVDLARVLLNFFKNESCGKCTPCRVGTHRAYDTLTKISEGQGDARRHRATADAVRWAGEDVELRSGSDGRRADQGYSQALPRRSGRAHQLEGLPGGRVPDGGRRGRIGLIPLIPSPAPTGRGDMQSPLPWEKG